jgi:hypothetical protein
MHIYQCSVNPYDNDDDVHDDDEGGIYQKYFISSTYISTPLYHVHETM